MVIAVLHEPIASAPVNDNEKERLGQPSQIFGFRVPRPLVMVSPFKPFFAADV
jgi:hypothetical protein